MKAALLIIDMQKRPCREMEYVQAHIDFTIKFTNWAINLFRSKGLPVVRVYHKSEYDGNVPGNPEFEFVDSLKLSDTDISIIKTRGSAFDRTELDEILKSQGIDTVILTGLVAEYCILRTYYDAENKGYSPVILQKAIVPANPDFINIYHGFLETIPITVLAKVL